MTAPIPDFMRGWPASLVEIAEVIGPGATLNLVDLHRGADYCYVPKTLYEDHRIVQAIGIEAAGKLIAEFGGIKLTMPVMAGARARKSLIATAAGRTIDIARQFGVTSRWVRMVRNRPANDPRQIDMFVSPEPEKQTKG